MGVTIHYRGTMDDRGQIEDLQRELADIAACMGWETHRLDDDWDVPTSATLEHGERGAKIKGHLGLKGISLIPPENGEALSFYVDANGHLRSIMDMIWQSEGQSDIGWCFTKTQFVGPDVHIWIIGLLKYLQKLYFSNLQVSDEGEFWETGNRATLEAKMSLINEKINELQTNLATGSFGDLTGLTAEQIATRIETYLKNQQRSYQATAVLA